MKEIVDKLNAEYEAYAAKVEIEISEEIAVHSKKLADIEQDRLVNVYDLTHK
jgi:hypothetical protein